ncbi:CPBP family intramembrane metalloprotease [bacterium]|nr:CPBP family intramembrane metalloprotease [bacterium]
MDSTLFPRRLAPLYGLVLALLPVVIVAQEFWWQMQPLMAAAYLFMLCALAYYALREYWLELATRGHEGGHGRVRSADLVMVAVFMLAYCGVWKLIYSFARGHAGLGLAGVPWLDNDTTYYTLGIMLFLAIYWLAHQFPGVRFDFNLRWRFGLQDVAIVAGLGLLTWAGLALYMQYYGTAHAPMQVFGVAKGSVAPGMYAAVGMLFALANALTEELWWRGVLMGALKPLLPPTRLIVYQGLAFGLLHWFGTPQGVLGVLLAGAWGMLLGWWVYKRGSLWPAVAVHFLADWLIFVHTN